MVRWLADSIDHQTFIRSKIHLSTYNIYKCNPQTATVATTEERLEGGTYKQAGS